MDQPTENPHQLLGLHYISINIRVQSCSAFHRAIQTDRANYGNRERNRGRPLSEGQAILGKRYFAVISNANF